jgi:TATA-binding protein-associated factor Taf7
MNAFNSETFALNCYSYIFLQVVDLPTIVESLKTIDNKSFYKTADICQVCCILAF